MKIQFPQPQPRTTPPNGSGKLSIFQREISFGNTFSHKDKKQLYEMSALLLQAGLTIREALEMIQEQTTKKKKQEMLASLLSDLQNGMSLHESMKAAKVFNEFEVFSVKAGEAGGNLTHIFEELKKYYEQRINLQKKITQALSYPSLVVLVAVGVSYFMITQVVPMFQNIFKQFDANLPPLTQAMLNLSALLREKGWLLLSLSLLTGAGLYYLSKRPAVVKTFQYSLLRMPYIGGLVRQIYLSRLCITLSLLLQSKVKLDEALKLTSDSLSFIPFKEAIAFTRQKLMEGDNFFEILKSQSIFPPIFKQMVRVGDKTANMDLIFERLAKHFEHETDMQIATLTSFIEPLLVVFVGGIVALILLSMYIPMFKLSETIAF